jgi:hypothetical protein
MVALSRSSLIRWIAPAGAIIAWLGVALALLLAPTLLEDLVTASGLPSLVPAAAPPLGSVVRILLALAGGAIAAVVVWSALFLLFGPGGLLNGLLVGEEGEPVVRRADAHPDAPPRKPISANADLGVPMPTPPPAVRPIPADLDQPIAAFHPSAIPETPREPVRPVAPLTTQPLAAGEWIETIDLTPSIPKPTDETGTQEPTPTIESLLERLEKARPRRLQPL